MNRILCWYFGGSEQPTFYIERDYTVGSVRIYAGNSAVVDSLSIDIKDDGVSIFSNVATLAAGENLEPMAEDFAEDLIIEAGSLVSCNIVESNGASDITVQLELDSEEEEPFQ